MSRLTDEQMMLVQRYVDRVRNELAELRLTVSVDNDLAAWARQLRSAPQIAAVTSTFDPEFSDVHPGNAFWTRLEDDAGRVVGCICARHFLTANALDLIRSHALFFDRKPLLDYRPVPVRSPIDSPILGGRVVYSGGYWLHPDIRGIGLSRSFPRLHRALALRHFDLDWYFVLMPDTPNRRRMARETMDIAGAFSCIDGYFPPRGQDGRYQLIYAHRGEVLGCLLREVRARRPLTRPAGAVRAAPRTSAACAA